MKCASALFWRADEEESCDLLVVVVLGRGGQQHVGGADVDRIKLIVAITLPVIVFMAWWCSG